MRVLKTRRADAGLCSVGTVCPRWNNASDNYIIYDTDLTELNGYKGGITQEAASGIVTTVRLVAPSLPSWRSAADGLALATVSGGIQDQEAYQYPLSGGTGVWSVYGFEYQPSKCVICLLRALRERTLTARIAPSFAPVMRTVRVAILPACASCR